MAEDTLIRVVEEREALRAEAARLREELAKEQRLTRFASTATREALAEEMNAHAKTQAELERRTAWSNAEIARLRAKYDKDLSDAEIAHQAEVARLREVEARVAELEGALRVVSDRAVSEALLRQDALDQARGLLERTPMPDPDGEGPTNEQLEKWADFINSMADLLFGGGLRAHPEPATTAATCTCGAESSGGPCLCTPAATGAK